MGSAQAAGASLGKGIDWGGIVDNALGNAKSAIQNMSPMATLAMKTVQPAADFTKGIITGDAGAPAASAMTPMGTAQGSPVTVALPAARPAATLDPIAGLKTAREMAGASAAAAPQAPAQAPGMAAFNSQLANYAAANGGKMSLREYALLAHAAGETSPLHMQVRNMAQNDEIAKLSGVYDQQFAQKQAAAAAMKDKGDPNWATALDQAVKERGSQGVALLHGVDPLKDVLAGNMAANANTPQPN